MPFRHARLMVPTAGYDPASVPYQRTVLPLSLGGRIVWSPCAELNSAPCGTKAVHRHNASGANCSSCWLGGIEPPASVLQGPRSSTDLSQHEEQFLSLGETSQPIGPLRR